jgi:hypothetical protein
MTFTCGDDPLRTQARRIWTALAGVPVDFPADGAARMVVSDRSRLCPPDWVGIVSLGGSTIGTVPADGLLPVVPKAIADLPLAARTDPDRLAGVLPVADVLGPATLPYRAPGGSARPEPSRRVARALGFRELGTQLSIRLHD